MSVKYDSSGGKVFNTNHRRRHVLNSCPRLRSQACRAMPPAGGIRCRRKHERGANGRGGGRVGHINDACAHKKRGSKESRRARARRGTLKSMHASTSKATTSTSLPAPTGGTGLPQEIIPGNTHKRTQQAGRGQGREAKLVKLRWLSPSGPLCAKALRPAQAQRVHTRMRTGTRSARAEGLFATSPQATLRFSSLPSSLSPLPPFAASDVAERDDRRGALDALAAPSPASDILGRS